MGTVTFSTTTNNNNNDLFIYLFICVPGAITDSARIQKNKEKENKGKQSTNN
jgi:hypothetical protein